ncbi:MAG: TlpA disulfide reductase family protein [Methylovulum sp.]|nr:TlpA disulfide reductase family protein [Methylovulum sp.]
MKKKTFITTAAFLMGAVFSLNASAVDVGQPAPQFTLPSLQQGQPVNLQQFNGKVVYLDFWASWCAPCRISFPLLNKLHQKLKSQGFEVVAINLDEKKENGEKFLQEIPVDFTVLHDTNGEWSDKYVVESMPTSFIIDKHGVVQMIHHGFTSEDINGLEQKINALLAEK